MKKLLILAALLFAGTAHAQGLSNLPPNTVIGRLGAGVPGPAQAIPFATLFSQLNAQNNTFGSISTWPLSLYSFGTFSTLNVVTPTSPSSRGAIASALRTSDDTTGTNVGVNITNSSLIVVDNTSVAFSGWANYWQGVKTATATAAPLYNLESSVENLGSVVAGDPYTDNPSNGTWNMRLDSGIGSGSPHNASGAIQIINNGAAFESGIIISSTALDTTSGTGEAIALAKNGAINWYSAASTKAWQIYSTATSGTNSIILESGDLKLSSGAQLLVQNTTDSASLGTGSTILSGGLSVAKNLQIGQAAVFCNSSCGVAMYDTGGVSHTNLFVSAADETILKVGKSGGTIGLQSSGFVDLMKVTDTGAFNITGQSGQSTPLQISTTYTGTPTVNLINNTTSQGFGINWYDGATFRYELFLSSSNHFQIFDAGSPGAVVFDLAPGGNLTIEPQGGTTNITGALTATTTLRANSGFSANGSAGVSTTCTITASNTYVFTFGLLTSKGANCT